MRTTSTRYVATILPDREPEELRVWIAGRPTLGIDLPEKLASSCSLGSVVSRDGDLIDSLLGRPLPARGSRIVLGRIDLATLLGAACLEHRALPSAKSAPARLASLRRSLKRGPHPCRVLLGVDPTSLRDSDIALLQAILCRISHNGQLPLRYRLDAICSYVRTGTFTGIESQRRHTRLWLEHTYRSFSTSRTPGPQSINASTPARAAATSLDEPQGGSSPAVGRRRSRECLVRTKPDVIRREVAADATLYGAWERVRDNARSRGTWSQELARFEARLGAEIARLSRALVEGTWRPGKARHITLDKPGGGVRHLHVPSAGDRVVERAISRVVSRLVDEHLSPWSFAFRPGRGVYDAVHELAALRDEGGTHVARFDLADCFDSVGHRELRGALRRYLDDPWLLAIVDAILARELPGLPIDEPLVGIAQGSPLSPLLCNLVLDDLDRGLFSSGYPAVRYADDLALVGACPVDAQEGLRTATALSEHLGFRIRPEKTSVVGFDDVVEFLGQRVGPDTPPSDPGVDEEPPAKRSLYLTARTANVHLHKGQVRAKGRDGSQLLSVPVSGVGRIVCLGPTGVAAGLRSYALHHGVEVVFLSRSGSWLGRYDGDHDADPKLRRRQYRLIDDPERALPIVRAIVAGKIANQRSLIMRYSRRSSSATTSEVVVALDRLLRKVPSAETRDVAMGFEGAAAKQYYRALAAMLPEEAGFSTRVFRPPTDPGNACLSFLYTLLFGESRAACAIAGLDPSVGLLHGLEKGRASLALDLIEEFRPLIVDTMTLSLFRRGRLLSRHFRRQGKAVLLNSEGRRIVLDAYESRMLNRFRSPRSETRITYRDGMREQARLLAGTIRGSEPRYQPITWR